MVEKNFFKKVEEERERIASGTEEGVDNTDPIIEETPETVIARLRQDIDAIEASLNRAVNGQKSIVDGVLEVL